MTVFALLKSICQFLTICSFGLVGFELIVHALHTMFPQSSIDAANIEPLSYDGIITEVLLPEATLMLICDDMQIDPDDARVVFEESRDFGMSMHADIDHPILEKVARIAAEVQRGKLVEKGVFESLQ